MERTCIRNVVCLMAFFTLFYYPVESIDCYQCTSTNSSNPFQCNEFLTDDIDMVPTSCDNVFGARFCVKHVGRFEVYGLDCYQCASADEWKCEDPYLVVEALEPTNCSHVFNAKYCIKTVGRYGGGIGTKRFCSSVHMGNYCEYVRQIGDKLQYRTCIYTCTGDGCNSAHSKYSFGLIWIALFSNLALVYRILFH